ncbi:MAG: hypothetical protein C4576_34425 [Desulfobacteraceae bacterium]|nr:MAG: hypothetical protein C4576_34425 [Desulfobacteraceae bacterium]
MKAHEHILTKQVQWARNRGISLIGSKEARGRAAYTKTLDENLFEPLLVEVRESFLSGDGNEILGFPGNPAKMQAIHSSSALGLNVFQYWRRIGQDSHVAALCGFCRKDSSNTFEIAFEKKYPINSNLPHPPNIDVVFQPSDPSKSRTFAIECKFSEPYSSQRHGGLKPKYLALDPLWVDIPNMQALAKSICPEDNQFVYFHAAQMIKHILGLKKAHGKNGFRLLYLWYDVPGREGVAHRNEVNAFAKTAEADGLKFHSLTYQKLIMKMCKDCGEEHGSYLKYITERYL